MAGSVHQSVVVTRKGAVGGEVAEEWCGNSDKDGAGGRVGSRGAAVGGWVTTEDEKW